MHAKRTVLLLAAVMVSLVIAVPLFSDDANAQGVTVLGVNVWSPPGSDLLDIRAGEVKTLYLHLENPTTEILYVKFDDPVFGKGKARILDEDNQTVNYIEIGPGTQRTIRVEITADSYSGSVRDINASLTLMVYKGSLPADAASETFNWTVHITSGRASENQYNKIMGIYNNPFPAPFDTSIYAAAATLILWLVIAFIVSYALMPKIITVLLRKHSKADRKDLIKRVKKEFLFIFILYGFTASAAVTGISEYLIRTIETITYIIYILIGMRIAWRMFTAVVDMLHKKKYSHRAAKGEDVPDDSLRPLITMVFKIILGMVATGLILGVLGLDTMLIATGAGIVGLAISFGAQSTLAQFFSGFTLLLNRPLRPGDLVRIGGNTETLKVIHVGFMMTTFRNWANSEIITMPNQMVVSSKIINVTAESHTYRISVHVRVPYSANVSLAKTLALEAMREHPRIIQDGSEEMPKSRFEDFTDSSMDIRVSGFVDDFEDHRSIAAEIRESIFHKFKENGIDIAVPKMDIYIRKPGDNEDLKY
ncbi:MAG: mechanosensitive ion channel [Methanomassiliicoccaceae archaeon]|nr:mechanosensitive ion channel [Methanomassiliicoccaceae archaeon]